MPQTKGRKSRHQKDRVVRWSTSALHCNQFLLKTILLSLSRDDNKATDNASFSPPRDFGKVPLHSRGGSTAERKLKKRKKAKEKGSILTRAGTLEAVFEQGEECSARGRISAGEEKRTSAVQGMKGLEKQCGIKLCEICWVGSGLAQWAHKRGLMRIRFTT